MCTDWLSVSGLLGGSYHELHNHTNIFFFDLIMYSIAMQTRRNHALIGHDQGLLSLGKAKMELLYTSSVPKYVSIFKVGTGIKKVGEND